MKGGAGENKLSMSFEKPGELSSRKFKALTDHSLYARKHLRATSAYKTMGDVSEMVEARVVSKFTLDKPRKGEGKKSSKTFKKTKLSSK